MINFTQQFNVLEVIFATKPPGLGLKPFLFWLKIRGDIHKQTDSPHR
jgi:hypothetical protein